MRLFAALIPTREKTLEHAAAYALLTHAVEIIYHMPLPEIARDSHGKPYFPAHPEICFNLSHCRGLAVCGISDAPLGVDCEHIRALRPGVLHRSFAPEELRAVQASPDPDTAFFQFWTLKEAFVKALGIGISYPLHTAVFGLAGDSVAIHPSGWQFRQFRLESGHEVACCISPEDVLPECVEFYDM